MAIEIYVILFNPISPNVNCIIDRLKEKPTIDTCASERLLQRLYSWTPTRTTSQTVAGEEDTVSVAILKR